MFALNNSMKQQAARALLDTESILPRAEEAKPALLKCTISVLSLLSRLRYLIFDWG
jgi:hypothetical protein